MKRILVLLYKFFGELQSLLLKKYVVPATKTVGENLFENDDAPVIGEVVKGCN